MQTSSSSDSGTDDDVPIKALSKKYEISSAMEALLRYDTEKCEFCARICYNKYDVFVHNASHITVPLYHGIPICRHCNVFFTTNAKLNAHNQTHHYQVPDILKDIIKSKPIVKMDKSVTELILEKNIINDEDVEYTGTVISGKETPEKLTSFVSLEPVIQCEDTVTKLIIGCKKSDDLDLRLSNDVEIIDCDEYDCKNYDDSSLLIGHDLNETIVPYSSSSNQFILGNVPSSNEYRNVENIKKNESAKIKSKILFEDDGEDIINLKNDTICDLTQSDSDIDENEEFKHNKIVLGSKVSMETGPIDAMRRKITIVVGNFAPSIHFDQLMKYGVFGCAYCEKAFPNRLQKITHEATHLKINPRPNSLYRKIRICQFCDQYIVGNHHTLKRHHTIEHADLEARMHYNWRNCDKCSLRYYSYWRHIKKYHLIFKCESCSKPFEKESALIEHKQLCRGFRYYEDNFIRRDRSIKVCQVCYLFEYHKRHKNIEVSDYSEPGKRVKCQRCDKEFFELKLLKYVIGKHKESVFHVKKKAPMTNEIRLKKFQQRLKSMKGLKC